MRTEEQYQRYYGMYLGTVAAVDVAGERTEDKRDPDQLGRVRINSDQFQDDNDNPIWATIVRPAAGETTVFFTPRVGDQVVFGFLAGDVNQPIVIGYAHAVARTAPEQAPRPDTGHLKHAIVTKTFRIDLNETPGERKLRLTNRDSGDFIEFDAEDKSLTISAETGIVIQSKGLIDIQAAQVQIQNRVVAVATRAI